MDEKERLIDLIRIGKLKFCDVCDHKESLECDDCENELTAEYLLANDVVPLVHSEWDYGDEPPEPDENGNVQAFCKRCGAGDVHAKRNINKVPYCWKCGAKMDGGKHDV